MTELAFFDKVAARAGVAPDTAQALTEATLRTLSERISGAEAAALADHLAYELRDSVLAGADEPEAFGYDEFLRRVGERAAVEDDVAERGVRAVLQTLHRPVGHHEFEDAMAQLPKEIQALAEPVPRKP
ncbi:DUF2267 domain-containing protein [Micromonospora sp. BQ11]|uniref:DUF2267 domain-containing protein n=1 Tax=Micromonospora sp. BQ11 TaxID=3452212 RepID=UPI003F89D8CE